LRDDRVYLQHIRDAIEDITAYCGSDHDAFLGDRMRQDATLLKLEVIGQAAKNLSEQTNHANRKSLGNSWLGCATKSARTTSA